MPTTFSRQARTNHPLIIAGSFLILLTLVSAAFTLWNLRAGALKDATYDLSKVALILGAESARSIDGVDLVLQAADDRVHVTGVANPAEFRQKLSSQEIHDFLHARVTNLPQLDAVVINDADGIMINSSRAWPLPEVDLSSFAHIRNARELSPGQLSISKPYVNPITGEYSIYVTRAIRAANGDFLGSVVGAIELHHFVDFYRTIDLGKGSAITLFNRDGTVLTRYPEISAVEGTSLIQSPIVQKVMAGAASAVDATPGYIGALPRIAAVRAITGYPLMISASMTQEAILSDWYQQCLLVGIGTAIALLGYVLLFVALSRQLSRREEAEARLAEAKDAAEAANRAKSDFLASMSHEIRTPMNGIMGTNHLLLQTPLNERQYLYAETIRRSTEDLLTVVNDILDISKLEAGRVDLEIIDFDMGALVESVLSTMLPRAQEKSIALTSRIPPEAQGSFRGDPTRLRQILFNLVGNAIKFTAKGGVELGILPKGESRDGVRLRFAVTDTGIGIPAEVQARLFHKFIQADGSITRRFGGSGLGLAICRQLVELMQGEIGIDSMEGGGSTFWFEVTVSPAAAAVPSTSNHAASTMPAAPTRSRSLDILLADDHTVNQLVASTILEQAGHRIDVVADGRQAVAAAMVKRYDLILMDIQMPELDGLQAKARIRALLPPAGTTPIIALTAHAMGGIREKCLADGFDDYLSKPFDPKTLVAKVEALGAARRGAEPADRAAGQAAIFDPAMLDSLKEMLPGADFAALVGNFIESFHENLDVTLACVARGELAEASREAHKLIATAGNLGAARITALARHLEAGCGAGDAAACHAAAAEIAREADSAFAALTTYRQAA